MSARTVDIVHHLLEMLAETPVTEPRRGVRDRLCRSASTLLFALEDEKALGVLRRACHTVALALDEAILAELPAEAALLDAAVRLGSAVELLAEGDEQEARGYAGAALMPLAQVRLFTGSEANVESALASVKSELRTRLRGCCAS